MITISRDPFGSSAQLCYPSADNACMSLGKKTLLLFLLLGCAICAGSYVALRMTVLPAFTEFELQAVQHGMDRVQSSFDSEIDELRILNLEYSVWDKTVDYVKGENPGFEEDNLSPGYWYSIDISALIVTDTDGKPHYGWVIDPESGEQMPLEQEFAGILYSDLELLDHDSPRSSVTGLIRSRSGIMHVTSYPILATNGTGPVFGTLVLGQFLNKTRLGEIGERSTADLSLHLLGVADLPGHVIAALEELGTANTDFVVATEIDQSLGYQILRDIHDEPVALVELRQPRTISQIGADTIRTAMLFLAAASIGFILAALLLIQQLIVSPIRLLTSKMRDIHATGNLEFEIEGARSDEVGMLATRFAELTKGLRGARDELEHARDEALSMSEAKSEFLARMSHEIRTPMNGVLGMTELLQNTSLNDKQQRFVRTIYGSAESLLHIIDDILDISKIEAGKLELDSAPFDMRDLVEDCLDLLADNAHRKGLELIGAIPTDAYVTVEGDGLRLRQILINLIGNAIKFTEQGEIIVRVEEQHRDSESVRLRFEIQDTGIGIGDENLTKVFAPFTQEDGSTTRRFGGTGLGLSICKQLLDLMGGEIGVRQNADSGCTFWFTVPLSLGKQVPKALQTEVFEGQRALIVDDNATHLMVLRQQLESWGMSVESAQSGPEALGHISKLARENRVFEIVLLDKDMPDMDGVELASAIRKTPNSESVPIVVLSPESMDDGGARADLSTIDSWIAKPARQSVLYNAIVSQLDRNGENTVRNHSNRTPSPKAANDSTHRPLRVLLAEDNEVNQALVLGMLGEAGHEILAVSNGQDATIQFRSRAFDLVLMDCQMPVLDGFEATESIRTWEQEQGQEPTPIIALTANASASDRQRCLDAGMNDHVGKPFTNASLHRVIQQYVVHQTLSTELTGASEPALKRVLIVDDNPINQQVTQAMVKSLGCDTDIAADGNEALRAVDRQSYDLILMDCHMPGLDGYDTTRVIRNNEGGGKTRASVPIVAVTADLMQGNRQRCLDAGMNDYVAKPFTEKQIMQVVNRWLNMGADQEPDVAAAGVDQLSETINIASIDRLVLDEILALDSSSGKQAVRDIVISYCAMSTKLVLQLRSAIADRDFEQVELLAHSLKGSSAQMGAVLLASLCEQILSGTRDQDLAEAGLLCERVSIEHAAFIAALDKELQVLAA